MAIASDFVGSAQKMTPLFRSQNLCGTPWRRCCRGLQMCAWFSPTVSAACNGMVVVLRQLIEEEEGISPNAETNNHGRKLLHEVCFHTGHRAANGAARSVECVRMLLAKGADPRARASHDSTPLHFSLHPEITQALLEAGADVNAPNDDNQSPLHLAAHHYSADVVKLLLAAGAEVNMPQRDENLTPLGFALRTIIREQGDIGASDSEAEEEDWERQHRRDLAAVRARDLKDCRVVVSLLLRAGAHISAEEITRVVAASQLQGSLPRVLPDPLDRYLKKVIAAGGYRTRPARESRCCGTRTEQTASSGRGLTSMARRRSAVL